MPGRMWIGLYNSYDPRKFHEAHRRALARAGPIALAYDANLCTLGFPYEGKDLSTPLAIVRWVADSTSIGDSGAYLVDLAEQGRFQVFDFPRKGFPPQLGAVVVTTNRPEPKKAIAAKGVADLLRVGMSVCLVFGLGPHGIEDESVYDVAAHHLDVTAKGLSLETATALGAVPAAVAAYLRG